MKNLIIEAVHVLGQQPEWPSWKLPPEVTNEVLAELGKRECVIARVALSLAYPTVGTLVAEYKAPPDPSHALLSAKGWHSPSTAAEWLQLRKLRTRDVVRYGPGPYTAGRLVHSSPLCVVRLSLAGRAALRTNHIDMRTSGDGASESLQKATKTLTLPACVEKAAKAMDWLEATHPGFRAFGEGTNTPTRWAWDYIRDNAPDGYRPPDYAAFARYVRRARQGPDPTGRLPGDRLEAEMAAIEHREAVVQAGLKCDIELVEFEIPASRRANPNQFWADSATLETMSSRVSVHCEMAGGAERRDYHLLDGAPSALGYPEVEEYRWFDGRQWCIYWPQKNTAELRSFGETRVSDLSINLFLGSSGPTFVTRAPLSQVLATAPVLSVVNSQAETYLAIGAPGSLTEARFWFDRQNPAITRRIQLVVASPESSVPLQVEDLLLQDWRLDAGVWSPWQATLASWVRSPDSNEMIGGACRVYTRKSLRYGGEIAAPDAPSIAAGTQFADYRVGAGYALGRDYFYLGGFPLQALGNIATWRDVPRELPSLLVLPDSGGASRGRWLWGAGALGLSVFSLIALWRRQVESDRSKKIRHALQVILPAAALIAVVQALNPGTPNSGAPSVTQAKSSQAPPSAGKLTGSHSREFPECVYTEEPIDHKHTFDLTNETATTITIKKVRPSCGCTQARAEPMVVGPGQHVAVETTLHLSSPGPRSSFVWLELEGGDVETLSLSGSCHRPIDIALWPRVIDSSRPTDRMLTVYIAPKGVVPKVVATAASRSKFRPTLLTPIGPRVVLGKMVVDGKEMEHVWQEVELDNSAAIPADAIKIRVAVDEVPWF
ncbi:MAG: DUF1573 domain-containing protein [Phycisphaerales bacterium]